MPQPRKNLICEANTHYYHCISRCVRKAFLCGYDSNSGISYEHRRKWVEDRIHLLAEVFAIDLCAYAVMSNHVHLVLRINKDKAKSWSTKEVIQRWHRLYKGTLLTQQFLSNEISSLQGELATLKSQTVDSIAEVWRQRLYDISWFMRSLNEPIARKANKEDECTGRFWEGRFKCQALLDDNAVSRCMAYVDLNPVRAGIANTIQKSSYTSIQYRLNAARVGKAPKRLIGFSNDSVKFGSEPDRCLPFTFQTYLDVLQTMNTASDVNEFSANCTSSGWSEYVCVFGTGVTSVGSLKSLQDYKARNKLSRVNGTKFAHLFD